MLLNREVLVPISRYALIIGTMKSGTTTLFNYLNQLPTIAGASPKEPAFFAFDDVFAQGRTWYDGLFRFDPAHHVWALEGSTDYSKAPFCGDVRARMATFDDAEFRMIFVMRHPLRRIESHAKHTQRNPRELGRNLTDRADNSLDSGISPVSMAIAHYAGQLDRYRDLFDKGKVLLLTFEELIADPETHVGRVCTFLGLEPPSVLVPPENENRFISKRRRAGWWDRLRGLPGVAPLVKAIIPQSARRALEKATAEPVRVSGRFTLTPDEETALIAELRPDLIRLRDVYGVDVERLWGIDIGPSGSAS